LKDSEYSIMLKRTYSHILGYTGNMLIGFSIVLMIPVIFCFLYPDEWKNSWYFVESSVITFIIGFALRYPNKTDKNNVLTVKEGAIVVLLVWTLNILFSALPFMFSHTLNFTQAVFEATSGWTTTGLTVVDVTKISKLLLIWRSLMQYFGGAGFAIIVTSSIIGPAGFGFYHAEGRTDNLLPNVKKSAKMIMLIYGTYAILGMFFYVLAGMKFFDAFNHSLTALATGGFSTRVNSIGEFNSKTIEFITIILMVLGTTGFGVHFTLWKGDFKTFIKNPEPWLLFSLILFFTPFVTNNLSSIFPNFSEAFRHSLFQDISALTGTGFSTVSFNNWPGFSMMALIILMIIGGGMDSTSGGLKLYRVFVLLKLIVIEVTSFFLPKNVVKSYVVWKGQMKRVIDSSTIKEILLIFALYFITYITGVMILLGHGYSVMDSLFEFASALSTVGLSVGITTPNAPISVLWTETVGMFLGRLEFMVVLYALAKMFRDIDILIMERKETKRIKSD